MPDMHVRLHLLGGIAVEIEGEATALPLDRPVSLLVYLAMRGDWVSRSELALLYRPDAATDEAYAYLRKLIFRARKLPCAHGLEVSADRVRWLVESDAADFAAAVSTKDWDAALAAYQGSFLGGETTTGAPGLAAWQDMQRESLQAVWVQASLSRAHELNAAGEYGRSAALLSDVLDAEPLAEEDLQLYLRTLAADGREREAIAAFERFRRTLLEEVGGTPLESTLVLVESLRRRASTGSGPRRRADLPEPVTEFVGREAELARLAEHWERPEARLVSIIGLGGSGKTRLAIEAARRYGSGRDGVVSFVSLAAVNKASEVAGAILSALELPSGRSGDEQALIDGLRDQETLLVLDNFEHVIGASALLVRLLESLPGLRLLVTSREPLGISGEWRFDIAGLVTAGHDEHAGGMTSAERLFVQRAVRYSPSFAATDATLDAITDICRRLDGLPLAIELAASWTRLLPVRDLRAELESQSLPLSADLADLPERHRSLWNVFDYTWERLDIAERAVLVRLAGFRGGFTLEAARDAAEADLKILLSLVDRTLVRRFEEGRFAIHELVRQYATSRGSGTELALATEAHATYYCSLLARLTPDLKGADVHRGLQLVQADIANFEAAWANAVNRRDLSALENARQALNHFYYYRGSFETAKRLFGEAITALQETVNTGGPQAGAAARLRGLLLAQFAEKEFVQGELDSALNRVSDAIDALREHGAGADLLHAKMVLANGLVRAARYLEARPYFQQVLDGALELKEDYLEGAAHNGLANVLSLAEGDMNLAIEHYQSSLRAHTRVGNLEGMTGAYTNLGACRFDLGDYADAERLWLKAVSMSRKIGFRDREAVLLSNLGAVAEVQGRLEDASERFNSSLSIRRELGNRPGIATVLNNLARLSVRQDDASTARTYAEDALETYRLLGDAAGETQSRSYLARILLQLDRVDEAADHLAKARAIAQETSSTKDLLGVMLSSAWLHEAQGDVDAALAAASHVAEGAVGISEQLRAEAEMLTARLAGG